ncbi:hypothetical protein [Kumtagia ephedrae]|jgi:cytochrome c2|nr:hypothetical protein [Mesorhizobium ephedrae]
MPPTAAAALPTPLAPRRMVPDTTMTVAMPDTARHAAIIAYLESR